MKIELRGVGFVNKGAELMLYSIIEEIRREIPDTNFVMESKTRRTQSKIKGLGLMVKSNIHRRGVNFEPLLNLLPKRISHFLDIALDSDIDVVLDGSGYAFGDKWGADKAGKRAADHIQKWKKQGKKVILLPQAFGPFSQHALVEKMKIILENADLVMARDKISYTYLSDISPNKTNILLFPDFTNLVKGKIPSYFEVGKNKIAIIPNQKMMETSNQKENDAYPLFLKNVVEQLIIKKQEPFFLIHEGKMDKPLAEKINESLSQPIEIINEENPLAVKGIIGSCKAVVTSRFHGLVSALSQAVPCLATGWSHKYEMLLRDYNFPEGLCSVNDKEDELAKKLEMILNGEAQDIRENLRSKSEEQKLLTRKMWEKVYQVIKE